jgi:ATP-dependent Clp protease ATP-binding subunit ClpX
VRSRGEAVVYLLLETAREQLGEGVPVEQLLQRAAHGLVFVDEVDKIRSHVGGQPNVAGIRAQEALLTLIENEAVPFDPPAWAGGKRTTIDSSNLLFVCAGAFEGLYDAVYDRVTIGSDRGALKPVTVVDEGQVHEETPFALRDWLRNEDLFEYGMSPQFLSRFDAVVLLDDLGEDELVQIFLNSPESSLRQSRDFFASLGIHLAISPAAVRRIAREAARQPRLGARALKDVFRRVVRGYEFDPDTAATGADRSLLIDAPDVEARLTH